MKSGLFENIRNRFESISLVWQLACLFIGQALLIVATMYLFSWKANLALIEDASNDLQVNSGVQISDKLTTFLGDALDNNKHNAALARENKFSTLPSHWKAIFFDNILHSKDITNVAVANVNGDYFGVDKRSSGQLITQISDRETGCTLVSTATNVVGEPVSEISRVPGYDPRTRPWYTSASKTKTQCWSEVYKHYSDDVLQIAVSYPLYDDDFTLKAVLVSAIRLTNLSRYLKTIRINNDSQIIIVDSKGLLVASTSNTPLFNITNGSTNRVDPRKSEDQLIRLMGNVMDGKRGKISQVVIEGKRININVTDYNHPLGLTWKIISAVPNDYYLGPLAHKQGSLYLSIGLLLLLLSLGCIHLMGQRMVKPLVNLCQAVNVFNKGMLFPFAPMRRKDELGQLTRSFELMARDNIKLHNELREKITDLEQANGAISESELKFRTLFNSTSDAIYVRSFLENGEVGPFIEVNDIACSRLGYTRDEMLGISTVDINHPTLGIRLDNIRNTLDEDSQTVFETTHLAKDGRAVPVEISSHQFTLDGNPVILSVARDISDRKNAEQELRESSQKYQQLLQQQLRIFDSSPVGIVIVNDRHVVTVNRKFSEIMGYQPEELVGKNTCIFYPSQEAYENFGRKYYLDFVDGKATHTETDLCRKDGSNVTVIITGGPIEKSNQAAGSIWIIEDMSERMEFENRIRKLSKAVEQSPTSILITDLFGNIEFVNPEFTNLTGYSAEEVIGKNPRILQSGQTAHELYQAMWSNISSGFVWKGELLNKSKDGRMIWERSTIAPLRDSGGSITHYLAIKENITEQKQVMEQLIQSQKSESIGHLASGIAHDFNNILSVIDGFGYIMKLKLEDGSVELQYLQKIMSASGRAAELTRSLLAFSRKQIMNKINQDLNILVTSVGAFISRLIGEHIALSISSHGAPLVVLVDTLQIEQVLINLTTNARDAMPNGGFLRITTSSELITEDFIAEHGYGACGRYAVITVVDTGCGMDDTTLKHIFDPFYTTKEIGKGTGLGMSMAMGIIQQHSGYIYVQSEVGCGTMFRIYLPQIEEEVTLLASSTAHEMPVSGSGTILVAEDELAIRVFMETLLTKSGYKVILADDGQDAVDKYVIHKDEIDLVILDVVMPRKSGLAARNEIGLIGNRVECILVSGYAGTIIDSGEDFDEHTEFLTKPIKPLQLLNTIKNRIKQK